MPTAGWATCSTSGGAISSHRYGHKTYMGNGTEIDMAGRPAYVNDLRGYSMFCAVVRDSVPTRLKHVVINDAETPRVTVARRARRALVSWIRRRRHQSSTYTAMRSIGASSSEPLNGAEVGSATQCSPRAARRPPLSTAPAARGSHRIGHPGFHRGRGGQLQPVCGSG